MSNSALLLPTLAGAAYQSSALPTVNADSTQGFSVGSSWLYTAAFPVPELLVCTDATVGAAVWVYIAPTCKQLLQSGPQFILPSSGTIGANGALTGLTAFPTTPFNCFMYFPVNAINSGSAAGWYWTIMSSTTAGTVYNNVYTSGAVPNYVLSPTPFSGTSGIAYTQTTSEVIAQNFTLPGFTMLSADHIDHEVMVEINNTANNHTVNSKLGGSVVSSAVLASTLLSPLRTTIACLGHAARQAINPNMASPYAAVASSAMMTSYNMNAAQALALSLQLAVATDFIIVRRCGWTLNRGV